MEGRVLKRNKKGFTLVEVIVVLVILSILAAVLIPSLTGYVDKAKKNAVIEGCHSCAVAAQTLASEAYAAGADSYIADKGKITSMAEATGTVSNVEANSDGEIKHLTYTEDDVTVTYCSDPDTCSSHDTTYTFGANNSDAIIQYLQECKTLTTYWSGKTAQFKNGALMTVDSEAPQKNGLAGVGSKVLAELKQLYGDEIQSFRVERQKTSASEEYMIYVSTSGLADLKDGERVSVTSYDVLTGEKTTGTMTWKYTTANGVTYRVLTGFKAD